MISENLLIVTAHAEFLDAALDELRHLDKRLTRVELLAPGIVLCATPDVTSLARLAAEQHPIFVRHIAPVQAIVPLTNTEQEPGQRFAVQTRLIQADGNTVNTVKRPYSSGYLNQSLAEAIAE